MTNTRWAMEIASSTLWVTSTMVRPSLAANPDTSSCMRMRVKRRERFVHQKDVRVEDERPGDRHSLLHAPAQFVRVGVLEPGQPDQPHVLLGPRPGARCVTDP